MKRFCALLLTICILFIFGSCKSSQASASAMPVKQSSSVDEVLYGKVMLYSSMQEEQLLAIKNGFESKYPNISMDYFFSGTGKVITKISTEQQLGQIAADVLWVGDPSDYIRFKEQGILQQYHSPECENIDPAFIDPEHYFCGARLVNVIIGYNTDLVSEKEAPKTWNDLLNPKWRNQIVITDPGSSGTTQYAIGGFMGNSRYGPTYLKRLKENGAALESGTLPTHSQVAMGYYKVGILLDYVVSNVAKNGAPLAYNYPKSDIIAISSPIALIKNCENERNGKLLYDFILSAEGQQILVDNSLMSVRGDIPATVLSIDEINVRSMSVDDEFLANNSATILDTFDQIFN